MKSKITVLIIIGIAVVAGISSYVGRANLAKALNEKAEKANSVYVPATKEPVPLDIEAEALVLNPDDTAQNMVGELSFVKGWSLTSDHDDFGGWSGLLVKEGALVAINDQGNWLKADFNLTGMQPVASARVLPFDPTAFEASKVDYDAESLVALPDGYLVGFEQQHRLMKLPAIGEPATHYETGVDLSGLSNNSGIEAMTKLPDGRLLMFAESGRDTQGRTPAWLVSPDGNKSLDFRPPENYEATDAATLPNGDVLLLMRYYSVINGASAQIRHITAAEIDSGIILGRQIAEIKKPMNVDNMEGLDVELLSDGTLRLFLISDDNFSLRQRTLFMVFDWAPDLTVVQNQQ